MIGTNHPQRQRVVLAGMVVVQHKHSIVSTVVLSVTASAALAAWAALKVFPGRLLCFGRSRLVTPDTRPTSLNPTELRVFTAVRATVFEGLVLRVVR